MKFEIELHAGDKRYHSLVKFLVINKIDYSHPHVLLQHDVSGRSEQLPLLPEDEKCGKCEMLGEDAPCDECYYKGNCH